MSIFGAAEGREIFFSRCRLYSNFKLANSTHLVGRGEPCLLRDSDVYLDRFGGGRSTGANEPPPAKPGASWPPLCGNVTQVLTVSCTIDGQANILLFTCYWYPVAEHGFRLV